MNSAHHIEYSKTSRAKCHGPVPCKGSTIELGTLRYGKTTPSDYGETVEWWHWGCVDAVILGALAKIPLEHFLGFSDLRSTDQAKVQRAIALRRVDAADVPKSAKSAVAPAQGTTSKKRKADPHSLLTSQQPTRPGSSTDLCAERTQEFTDAEENLNNAALEEDSKDELYCSMPTSVVGIQYYDGLVGSGEEVILVREPGNRYDRNAIQVKNIGRVQVGHLPRNVAAKLAPLLDRDLVTVEGVMHEGNLSGKSYSLSMTLKIYGSADKRDVLESQLIWATPRQRGFPPRNKGAGTAPAYSAAGSSNVAAQSLPPGVFPQSSAGSNRNSAAQLEAIQKQQEALAKARELKQMIQMLEKVDDEGRRYSLLDTLCSSEDVLNLPLHPNPPGIKSGDLKVNLLKHQSQALQWCLDREYPSLPKKESDKPVQFWQFRKTGNRSYYFNVVTKTPQDLTSPPPLGRGALCADSMGLGKTLTMLALILATKGDTPVDHSRSTLIVVPLSVMSNWEKQIQDHCTPGALTHCVYYGSNRSMSVEELGKYDIVITTYQTVTADHTTPAARGGSSKKKQKTAMKSLYEVKWKRIILDEGHNIRNPKTKMAKAVCDLKAQRRWVLSGTPIVNSPRDLGSLLMFLRICQPLDNEDFYKRMILRPLKDGLPTGSELLKALMSHVCIRRTKEMQDSDGNPLVPLPPVEVIMVPVALAPEARALYDEAEHLSKERFENYMSGSGENSFAQSNVLGMLTRLRQIALHPGLIPANYIDDLKNKDHGADAPTVVVNPEIKARLQAALVQAIEDNEECPICFSILEDARITPCSHPFCRPCITEVISRDPKCPMDRRALSLADLISPPPPTELTQAPVRLSAENTIQVQSSAKIDQLIHLLKLTPAGEKSLVFSQFTSFLDKIAEEFEVQGIPYVRFDGQMSAKRRQDAIAQFSIPLEEDTLMPDRNDLPIDQIPVVHNDDDDDDVTNKEDYECPIGNRSKGKHKARNEPSAHRDKVNPKVMLISLKAGALGLNLTVANNVFLMDPWWQEGIESQAIDRCNRIGQKKPVHVYQLIAENTVESKVIEIQEKKKTLISQAFSGIKGADSQRQKKEARLQDLVQLFGIRQSG